MGVGTSQEAEAVRQDLERALAEHQAVELDPLLEDPEHEILLLLPRHVAQILLAGKFDEFLHRKLLQPSDGRIALFERLVMARHVEAVLDLGGDFLGDRQRFAVGVAGR